MSSFKGLGLGIGRPERIPFAELAESVVVRRPLSRIFAFTGLSIDQVVNDPIAKNMMLGYFKLQRNISRASEVVDLERQWNPRSL